MAALKDDRLMSGYDMPFVEQVRYAFRSMPYGSFMAIAKAISKDKEDIDGIAQRMWNFAYGNEDQKEQTTEERTRLPRGGESDTI